MLSKYFQILSTHIWLKIHIKSIIHFTNESAFDSNRHCDILYIITNINSTGERLLYDVSLSSLNNYGDSLICWQMSGWQKEFNLVNNEWHECNITSTSMRVRCEIKQGSVISRGGSGWWRKEGVTKREVISDWGNYTVTATQLRDKRAHLWTMDRRITTEIRVFLE